MTGMPPIPQPSERPSADLADLESLSIDELEEQVIFGEWRRLKARSTRSLQRTRDVMHILGYDPASLSHSVIGVVGSKGKGTTAMYASAVLAALGKRTGTVTSPGVMSNADRIRIDGAHVEPQLRRRTLIRLAVAREQLPEASVETGYLAPTGLFVLMAMLIFAESGCDVVVAEAGMGGASDDLSSWPLDTVAVSPIFAEHVEILGPEISDIARNKSAVITEATHSCVSAEQTGQVFDVISQRARIVGTELLSAEETLDHLLPKSSPYGFSRHNALVGMTAALKHLGYDPTASNGDLTERLRRVMATVTHPGRLSVHHLSTGSASDIHCVVDSPVNGAGLRQGLDFTLAELGGVDEVYVCIPEDKDISGFVAELRTQPGRLVFVNLPGAYITMPDRAQWPWEWIDFDTLSARLAGTTGPQAAQAADDHRSEDPAPRRVFFAGTVLFTSAVLRELGVDAKYLFRS